MLHKCRKLKIDYFEISIGLVMEYFGKSFDERFTVQTWYYDPAKATVIFKLMSEGEETDAPRPIQPD